MIAIAGFNTALDRRLDVEALHAGSVQRARSAAVRPGGKGLHVAQTVAALGEHVSLVGLDDVVHEVALRDYTRGHGIEWHGVRAPHDLRQCLAIHEADGRVTEILEPGPELGASVRDALLTALDACMADARILVLSGSLPRGFAADAYARIIRAAAARGVRCLLDASGEALRAGIAAQPWLVKPNADEASALWGRPVRDVDAAAGFTQWLHGRGIERVIVTLGARGAVAGDGQGLWHAQSAPVEVRDSVGSGDCFLAGLAVAAARGETPDAALRLAIACGAGNAEGGETGLATPARVAAWLPRVTVTQLAPAAQERA